MDERRQILKTKLVANRQRLARQFYLQSIPQELSLYLSQCQIVQSPELDKIVPMFWCGAEGTGYLAHQLQGYTYRRFSWPEEVLNAARSVGSKYDEVEAFLFPFEDNPLYCVRFGWVRNNLDALLGWEKSDFITGYGPVRYSPQQLAVATTDMDVGLVINHYCGYLEEDPNPQEVVYELAIWGF